MLNREDWIMIKQMHEKGCYFEDIAYELGVSPKTISRALHREGAPGWRKRGVRPSKLDAYKAEIDWLLGENIWNAEVIYAHVREQGYAGSKTILREYIHPKRSLRKPVGTVRFETAPAEQLQHDWGELWTLLGGERQKVYIAVNTLGYSRRFHVWATLCNDAEHTYESLVRCFEHFGGVPQEVWVDNQKAAVIEHLRGGRPRFNAGFVALAGHYGFRPKACRPGRPQTKGKDERMVGYVKHNFFQRYQHFEDLAHLNQLLGHWLETVADPRCHGTFKEVVIERFAEESGKLRSLPPRRFDTSYRELRRVAMDAFIEARGNRYSVPARLCSERVSVHIGLDERLKVYDEELNLVAEHLMRPASQGWQVVPEHHARLWKAHLQVESRDLASYQEVL